MQIKATVEVAATVRALEKVAKQIPYASARALTITAQQGREVLKQEMPRVFDRPTPFTMNSVFIKAATKDTQTSVVWFKDSAPKGTPAAKYLMPEVKGGNRDLKRSERALALKQLVPQGTYFAPGKAAPLDAYGNLTRGLIQRILSQLGAAEAVGGYQANETKRSRKRAGGNRVRYFLGQPAGGRFRLGIWQSDGRNVKPILMTISRPTYRVRLRFWDLMKRVHAQTYKKAFGEQLSQAMRSSK